MFVLLFVTGCQSSTENRTEKASGFAESESKKNGNNPIETPKSLDSIQIVDYEEN